MNPSMKLRYAFAFVTSLLLPLTSLNAASSNELDEAFSPDAYMNQLIGREAINRGEKIGFTVSGDATPPTTTSLLVQPPGVKEGEVRGSWLSCESTKDTNCDFANAGFNGEPGKVGIMGWNILPKCTSPSAENCIESFEISYDDKEFASANYLQEVEAPSIPSDPTLNYLGGGSATLWNDSGLSNSKSFRYMVSVSYGNAYDPSTKIFDVTELNVSIRPYIEVQGDFRVGGNMLNSSYAWFGDGKAGVLIDFPKESKFRVKVRASSTLSGWFKGRLKNPVVDISRISGSNNLLSIEGEPVAVPTFFNLKNRADMSKKEDLWRMNNGGSGNITNATAYQWDIFEYLDHFRPLVEDKAAGVNTFWSLNSTIWGNNSPCLVDKERVVGIVSTNAMGYDGSSPSYEDGTLNYRVAGMHYMPDGVTLIEGTYDLIMRSDAARCLYGFSKAPVQASISITGEQSQTVAVTAMTENNGWIKLSAYGFNFSSPTIKVKLTQEKAEMSAGDKPTQERTEVSAAKPVAKKSVICIRDKKVLKRSGTKPKCPIGYKKR